MSESKKDMFLHEYDEMTTYLRSFWTLRATVLAAGLTLMGFLVSISATAKFPSRHVYDLLLLSLIYVIGTMLASMTRAGYLYMERMREISVELGAPGFWQVWPVYVKRHPMDSGSSAYLVILHFLNFFIGLYVVSYHVYILVFEDVMRIEGLFSVVVVVVAVPLVWVNNRMVSKDLNPAKFIDGLYEHWRAASEHTRSPPD